MPDEIFNKLIIVNQFLIIHLGSTFEFHLLRVVLPFNFDFDKGVTNQFKHFVRIALELHANVERVGLHLLRNQAYLVVPLVTKWVLRILMSLNAFVLFQVQPFFVFILLVSTIIYKVIELSVLTSVMVFQLCELVFVISPESSVDFIKPLQVGRSHSNFASDTSKS